MNLSVLQEDKNMDTKINVSDYFKLGYVYYLWDGDDIVYIGQTTVLSYRIKQHLIDKVFDSFTFIRCELDKINEIEGDEIIRIKPKYNSRLLEKNGYIPFNSILKKAYQQKYKKDTNPIFYNKQIRDLKNYILSNKIEIFNLHHLSYIKSVDLDSVINILQKKI